MTLVIEQPSSLTLDSALEAIRTAILQRAKGVGLSETEIDNSTALWATEDPNQPCLSLDSLDFLEIVVYLEDKFGWVIPEEAIDIQDCKTVGDLAQLVVTHVRVSK